MFTARIKRVSSNLSLIHKVNLTISLRCSDTFPVYFFSSSFKWNEKLVYSTFFVHNDAHSFIQNCHDIPKYSNSGSTPIRHGGNCFKIPWFHETNGMKENSIWMRGWKMATSCVDLYIVFGIGTILIQHWNSIENDVRIRSRKLDKNRNQLNQVRAYSSQCSNPIDNFFTEEALIHSRTLPKSVTLEWSRKTFGHASDRQAVASVYIWYMTCSQNKWTIYI